jgi:hypothetical protein
MKKHVRTHIPCADDDRAIKLIKGQESEVKFDVSDGLSCTRCNKEFSDFQDLTTHLNVSHKLPYNKTLQSRMAMYRLVDFKCLLCNETFQNLCILIRHTNRSHSMNCYVCQDCGRNFNKERDLRSHMNYYHKKEYKCVPCSLTFASKDAFLKHKSRPHVSVCNICFEKFPSDKKRLEHMHREHFREDSTTFVCGFCNKQYNTKLALLNHVGQCKIKGKIQVGSVKIDLDNRKQVSAQIKSNIITIINMSTAMPFRYCMNKFGCFFCLQDFAECEGLRTHTLTKHPSCDEEDLKWMRPKNYKLKLDISSLSCKVCREPILTIESLIDHLTTDHKTDYDKSVKFNIHAYKLIDKEFPCLVCNETFELFWDLMKHSSQNHRKMESVCMHCGKSFNAVSSLNIHLTAKHNPEGYKCEICNAEFKTGHLLNGHMGKVHGKKTTKCKLCTEKFINPHMMRRHMIEAHDRGYKCSHCGKLFTNNSFMVEHVRRTHLKEKNAECSVCFERFFDHRLLNIHMVKHVGERKFHCDVCGKSFLWKKNLRVHLKSHK